MSSYLFPHKEERGLKEEKVKRKKVKVHQCSLQYTRVKKWQMLSKVYCLPGHPSSQLLFFQFPPLSSPLLCFPPFSNLLPVPVSMPPMVTSCKSRPKFKLWIYFDGFNRLMYHIRIGHFKDWQLVCTKLN